jgi:hypothetical protein
MRKVIGYATPSKGVVSFWWTRSMNIGKKLMFVQDSAGDMIAETRNRIVADAFAFEAKAEVEFDSLFWVDDDVLVSPGALLALYNHHAPIVSGVYFTKCELPEPLIFPSRLGGTAKFVPNTIVKNAWGHGMGLTLVRMEVYRKMAAAGLPNDRYGHPEFYKTVREMKMEGELLDCGGTEDLYFCEAAAKLGYKSIIDCTKQAFGWHFDMATGKGYPEPQFARYAKCEPIEWDTDEGTVIWS